MIKMALKKTIQTTFHTLSGCYGIVSKDNGLWHLSISHPKRLPTYDELKEARYNYMPELHYVAQIFPPKNEFVNLHPYCLHLWELSGDVSYTDDRRQPHANTI